MIFYQEAVLNRCKCISLVRLIHSKPDESENGDLNVHFGFVFEENSVSEITR